MSNLKKGFLGLVIAAAILFSGASAIAVSIWDVEVNHCPIEVMDDLPDKPGRF